MINFIIFQRGTDEFRTYVNDNFVLGDFSATDRDYYVKWIDTNHFGNQLYRQRTISSLTSQLLLPKSLSSDGPKILAGYLKINNITYSELSEERISTDYTNPQAPKISLINFMDGLLNDLEAIVVPSVDSPDTSINYHFHLYNKDNSLDYRIKILDSTYEILCEKVAEKIIEHGKDSEDFDLMHDATRKYLAQIFFANHSLDGALYNKSSQIGDTF
ncbi:MAG: hypothetical protein LBF00_01225 [Mycoplasmataceae bacterium]|nr:hypothetical protein [Mycoplasmataceae bacterium]